MPQTWGYSDCNGPQCWGKTFPLALGQRQSPIDIVTSQVQNDPMLLERPLVFNYENVTTKEISNGGFGWRVDVNSETHNLEGGPLNHRYRLLQFHSHWGQTCCEGSEHTVNGETFSGELHLVHYNIDLYEEPAKAMSGENGLSVIGVLLREGKEHPEFAKLCSLIDRIKHKGKNLKELEPFDIKAFLPDEPGKYWTYEGSLTTPPCFESVTWIVMVKPIELSKEQFEVFRSMLTYCEGECELAPIDGPVVKNWRACQPIENRVIRQPGNPE